MQGRSAYGIDLRERIMGDYDGGLSALEVAKKYRVSRWLIYKLKKQREETGSLAPLQRGGYKPQALAGKLAELEALIKAHPDATLEELRKKLGVKVDISVLWRAIDRLGLSYKKNPSRQRTRAGRRSCAAQGVEGKSGHA